MQSVSPLSVLVLLVLTNKSSSLIRPHAAPSPPSDWLLGGPAVVRRHIYTGRFLTNRPQRVADELAQD